MTRPIVISHRSSLGAHLDDLLAARFLPKRWAGRIWSASDLPPRLERCVRNLVPHCEWRAYGDEDQVFFALARPRNVDARAGSPVSLEVFFLDADASVYSAGVWEHDSEHGWWLDSLVDLSYDCEYGWCLDTVMDTKASADGGRRPPLEPAFGALPSVAEARMERARRART